MKASVWVWLLCATMGYPGISLGQSLPADFQHDRVFVQVKGHEGAPMLFYTDTGGGWNALTPAAATQLKLPEAGTETLEDGKPLKLRIFTPALAAQIPAPLADQDGWLQGRLVEAADVGMGAAGFLGSRWFAGRRWLFDYPAKAFSLWPAGWMPGPGWHATPMHFKVGRDGDPGFHFPRIAIEVDGQALDVLLDTGATATLGEDAAKAYGLSPGTRVASSFIVASVFNRWQRSHPEWRVAESGDIGVGRFPMIEVPQIVVAGLTVGPVWFAMREDSNFHEFLSPMTDQRIEGAIGGSAFRYLRMGLDYPGGVAWFQLPADAPPQRH